MANAGVEMNVTDSVETAGIGGKLQDRYVRTSKQFSQVPHPLLS
jgi:hypothetical protein